MARTLSRPYDLFIYSGHGAPPFCSAPLGLVYCHFPTEAWPDEALKDDDRWLRRHALDRRVRSAAYRLLWRVRMRGYQGVLANSRFTAGWIERRWNRSATVLYPPVDLEVPETKKRNLIVSLGRFDGGLRSKNQLEQVRAFRAFLARVGEEWSLQIIGSEEDRAYRERVQEAARGLPIAVLTDADRTTVRLALAEAKLFWHTTGLATAEERSPETSEHFGIATVEAMRARCVPIVLASGGQREIVEDGVSGVLCRNFAELTERSVEVAWDAGRQRLMSDAARRRSRLFGPEAFEVRLAAIVGQCLESERGMVCVA